MVGHVLLGFVLDRSCGCVAWSITWRAHVLLGFGLRSRGCCMIDHVAVHVTVTVLFFLGGIKFRYLTSKITDTSLYIME